jgi:hypothetical protein
VGWGGGVTHCVGGVYPARVCAEVLSCDGDGVRCKAKAQLTPELMVNGCSLKLRHQLCVCDEGAGSHLLFTIIPKHHSRGHTAPYTMYVPHVDCEDPRSVTHAKRQTCAPTM